MNKIIGCNFIITQLIYGYYCLASITQYYRYVVWVFLLNISTIFIFKAKKKNQILKSQVYSRYLLTKKLYCC